MMDDEKWTWDDFDLNELDLMDFDLSDDQDLFNWLVWGRR